MSARHHDALEFPDGEVVLQMYLMEGATVLQLPAAGRAPTARQQQEAIMAS